MLGVKPGTRARHLSENGHAWQLLSHSERPRRLSHGTTMLMINCPEPLQAMPTNGGTCSYENKAKRPWTKFVNGNFKMPRNLRVVTDFDVRWRTGSWHRDFCRI